MADRHENTFRLVIASVAETFFDGAVASATLPGAAGEFELLPHHEAIISTLQNGTVRLKLSGGMEKKFPITGGVVECSAGRAVVLL